MTVYTKQNNTVDPRHASDHIARGYNNKYQRTGSATQDHISSGPTNIKQKTGAAASDHILRGLSGGLRNRTGNAVQEHIAIGRDQDTLTRRGFAISDHLAQGLDADLYTERGSAISASRYASSPAVPKRPQGMFNLALDQDAMVQDPVWTVVWP